MYGSWGSTSVQRGDDWAQTNRYTNRQTGTTTRTVRTDEGSAVTRRGSNGGTVAVGDGGNVYAGKDGNAYRQQDGTWQKYDNGNWSNTDRQPSGERPQPTTGSATGERPGATDRSTVDQLNRDSARDARARSGPRTTGITGVGAAAPRRAAPAAIAGGGGRAGGGGEGADSSTNSDFAAPPM